MLKAVVKHSYLKGSKGVGKAQAHINYIQYREGEDRGKGPREFFSEDKEHVLGRDIKERLLEQEKNGVTMHKIILSPGVQGAELKEYTREMMDLLEREKGQPLEWYAVEHRNTDHAHAHVIVMGKDEDGGRVRLDLDDMKHLRQWGDRYLEREHKLERYLDREQERLLKDEKYRYDRGDKVYDRLMYGDPKGEKKRTGEDAERDRREWEILDRDMHKTYSREHGLEKPKTYQQFQRESAGRLQDFHESHTTREARERWQELAKQEPELAQAAAKELEWLDRYEVEMKEERQSNYKSVDLEKLMDGLEPWERDMEKIIEREIKEMESDPLGRWEAGKGPLALDEKTRESIDPIRQLFGIGQEAERELPTQEPAQDKELEREDQAQTFEIDRMTRGGMGRDEREEEERDRDDDTLERGR